MAVNMKDIAKALNVSVVTVSKVLNNHSSISEATRQRVLGYAKLHGYRTNLAAKGLVTGRSMMVGFIVPDLVHGFFSEIAASMSEVLRQHGYGLLISSSREDVDLERREIQQMLSRSVDALVVATCEVEADELAAAASEAPLILIDRRVAESRESGYVGTDDLLAGELATQHLVDIGRRRIAHIGGPDFSPSKDRERAYRSVLARAGIEVPDGYVVKRHQSEETGHVTGAQSMRLLLEQSPLPDAVFCYNDPTAIGAMSAVLEAGLRIPEDIAIVGCGNIRHAAFLQVPLTSIDQDAPLLGQETARLLLDMTRLREGDSTGTRSVVIKPTLAIRRSTCCQDNRQ